MRATQEFQDYFGMDSLIFTVFYLEYVLIVSYPEHHGNSQSPIRHDVPGLLPSPSSHISA